MKKSPIPESLVFATTPDHSSLIICDPDELQRVDEDAALQHFESVVVAVINAGYTGVDVAELKLSSGRYVHSICVKEGSPEAEVLALVKNYATHGVHFPVKKALAIIASRYANGGQID